MRTSVPGELDLAAFLQVRRECEHRERLLLPAALVARERGDAHCVLCAVVEHTVGVFAITACSTRLLVETIQ